MRRGVRLLAALATAVALSGCGGTAMPELAEPELRKADEQRLDSSLEGQLEQVAEERRESVRARCQAAGGATPAPGC